MSKYCQYCGDELIPGHRSFGICAWCVKEIDDTQKMIKAQKKTSYFNRDRDDYKGEIDYG